MGGVDWRISRQREIVENSKFFRAPQRWVLIWFCASLGFEFGTDPGLV